MPYFLPRLACTVQSTLPSFIGDLSLARVSAAFSYSGANCRGWPGGGSTRDTRVQETGDKCLRTDEACRRAFGGATQACRRAFGGASGLKRAGVRLGERVSALAPSDDEIAEFPRENKRRERQRLLAFWHTPHQGA